MSGRPDRRAGGWASRVALAIVGATLMGLTMGCREQAPQPGRSGTGGPGGQPSPTARIAALSPAVAEILRDLGGSGAIVARHAYDRWSDPSLPACGEQGRIDYELLLSVRPTHVIVQDVSVPARLGSLASEQRWEVKNLSILSLDDIRAALRFLAGLFPGDRAVADRQREIEAEMDRAWRPRQGFDAASVGRVLLLAGVDPPSALGPGSFHAQILERLGGRSATPTGSPYIVMDAEEVLKLAPEAIVLILPRTFDRAGDGRAPARPSVEAVKAMLGTIGTMDLPAVRNGRVALIDDPAAHLPGTSMIGLADELAEILERWANGEE